ncbi:unnamed protein product, partial [Amoebophrya sp. A25]|eukprot:GSA25T00005989001.1
MTNLKNELIIESSPVPSGQGSNEDGLDSKSPPSWSSAWLKTTSLSASSGPPSQRSSKIITADAEPQQSRAIGTVVEEGATANQINDAEETRSRSGSSSSTTSKDLQRDRADS